MPTLVPLDGHAPLVITRPMTLFGRGKECDVRLHYEDVSDLHCILALRDGLLLLCDLGTDKTRVNGRRVRRASLLANDQFAIGACWFRVRYEENTVQQAS